MDSNKECGHQVKVGILGAGTVVEMYHLPVLYAMSDVRVEWICDVMKDRAYEVSKPYRIRNVYTNLEQCSDVNVVLVAIPVGYRRKSLEHIFQRGWHALCEKPFATTCEEHDWIVQQAAVSGVEIGVGLMRRFYKANVLAKDILSRLPFGPILEIWASEGARMRGTGREEGWYQSSRDAAGGGVLIETGSHLIDQVFTMCAVDDYVVESCLLEYRRGLDYQARILSTVSTAGGEKYRLDLALSKINDLYNGIMIQFPSAQLRMGVTPDSPLYLHDQKGKVLARLDNPKINDTGSGVYRAFYLEWREFLAQCMTRRPSRVSGGSARLSTRLIESCYQQNPPEREASSHGKIRVDKV